MTLASATVDDSGDYTLTVKNPHGEKSTKATVLVKGKASASNLPVSDLVIVLHESVVLMLPICDAPCQNPTCGSKIKKWDNSWLG